MCKKTKKITEIDWYVIVLFYQVIKKKLDTLVVQKPNRVVPLFDTSVVREYENKKQMEEEARKEKALKKLTRKPVSYTHLVFRKLVPRWIQAVDNRVCGFGGCESHAP